MKKIIVFMLLFLSLFLMGFDTSFFKISNFENYNKEFKTEEIKACATSSTKTYMDYRAITSTTSAQYRYIQNYMEVDGSGLLIDEDGFVGVALGSYFGSIGQRYYFTLETGVVIPVVKIDEKADADTNYSGCSQAFDGSVIEFVIDRDKALDYFGRLSNNYVLNGNFNNYKIFSGRIEKVERALEEKRKDSVVFVESKPMEFDNKDIFKDTSGY